jgi:hypothetical protein
MIPFGFAVLQAECSPCAVLARFDQIRRVANTARSALMQIGHRYLLSRQMRATVFIREISVMRTYDFHGYSGPLVRKCTMGLAERTTGHRRG